jgi:hypothetical protein
MRKSNTFTCLKVNHFESATEILYLQHSIGCSFYSQSCERTTHQSVEQKHKQGKIEVKNKQLIRDLQSVVRSQSILQRLL